jgi:hypothetical protein
VNSTGSPALESARIVVIVARDRPDLYQYLLKGFTGINDVEIIVDQRLPKSSTDLGQAPVILGCQWRPDIYDELTLRGFVIKRLAEALSWPDASHPGLEQDGLETGDDDDRDIVDQIDRQEEGAEAANRKNDQNADCHVGD